MDDEGLWVMVIENAEMKKFEGKRSSYTVISSGLVTPP